ncbi:DNA-binding protein [Klebsiella pneumoniae]|nr:DNA-binding protein [Klebsiella pneumoniae]
MSATESKVKTAPKTSKKTLKSAEAEALKVALDAAQVEYVPVTALVKSPLNVRTIPYPAEKVCSMADSIEAIGLLQNLVVHNLPDGRCGVAAGGRRLKALQLLQSENRIDAGYQVMVKKVPDELACCGINGRKTNSRWQCIRLNRSPGSAHWQSRGKPPRRLAICWGSVRVMFSAC